MQPGSLRKSPRLPFLAVDPRVSRSRSAVIRAATDLLVDGGPNAVTIDAIVARSGVAKSTIYRHWGSRDEVLLSVIEACAPELPDPDPDADVVTSIRASLHAIVRSLNDPNWARMLPALLMLRHHEAGIAAVEQRIERKQDFVLTTLLERAGAEGVIATSVDVPEAIAMLVGPLLFARLTETVALDEGLADRALDRFLAAHRPQPPD
jgi:AcrR family transcriptional regulator